MRRARTWALLASGGLVLGGLAGLAVPRAADAASARPTVSSVAALQGSVAAIDGGDTVVVHGTNFRHVTAVTFGARHGMHVHVSSPHSLTVDTPRHVVGSVDVRVSTSAGRSAKTKHDRFVFVRTDDIALGNGIVCANGTSEIVCIGNGTQGQLGDGGTDDSTRLVPVQVPGAPPIAGTAMGWDFGCALTFAGAVWCWGNNDDGELGNGHTADSDTPVFVKMPPAVGIATGFDSACAILRDRTLRCWGANSAGQLGTGTTTGSPVPVRVAGGLHVTSVAVGSQTACAVDTAQHAWCWGNNNRGAVGDGLRTDTASPVRVTGLRTVTSVASGAGAGSMCAITTSEHVACWGEGDNGQLGNGTTTDALTAQTVGGLSGVTGIGVGTAHVCVVGSADGTLSCWGWDSQGQLGIGAVGGPSRSAPVAVPLAGAITVAAGDNDTCALTTQGSGGGNPLLCWGGNTYGQLGDQTTTAQGSPVPFGTH